MKHLFLMCSASKFRLFLQRRCAFPCSPETTSTEDQRSQLLFSSCPSRLPSPSSLFSPCSARKIFLLHHRSGLGSCPTVRCDRLKVGTLAVQKRHVHFLSFRRKTFSDLASGIQPGTMAQVRWLEIPTLPSPPGRL